MPCVSRRSLLPSRETRPLLKETPVTTREQLHHLIDRLPDEDLPAVQRVLSALCETADLALSALAEAPLDDEPLTDEDEAAIAEGWEHHRAGKGISAEDAKRLLLP